MMIADQTRMLGVEIGWTLILAQCVQWLANTFHDRRIKREQNEALGEITKEGLVPKGYRAIIEEGVKLERIEDKNTSWANKNTASKIRPEKSDSFASSVDKSRGEVISQPAL